MKKILMILVLLLAISCSPRHDYIYNRAYKTLQKSAPYFQRNECVSRYFTVLAYQKELQLKQAGYSEQVIADSLIAYIGRKQLEMSPEQYRVLRKNCSDVIENLKQQLIVNR